VSKTRIIESVKRLDVASTRALLREKPELIGVTDRAGRNLLHIACSASGKKLKAADTVAVRMATLLLDNGMEIDVPVGRDACTALFFAVARARNPALVKLLLERGAKVTNAPGGGLFAAGWWEDIDILKILLRAGAPIEVVEGVTPFLACWCWKRFDAAQALALAGANVNYQDGKGKTALHHGLEKDYAPALLRWLVDHGASPDIADRDGVTPRVKASRKRAAKYHSLFEP
jgi:ankyrin repeat protein